MAAPVPGSWPPVRQTPAEPAEAVYVVVDECRVPGGVGPARERERLADIVRMGRKVGVTLPLADEGCGDERGGHSRARGLADTEVPVEVCGTGSGESCGPVGAASAAPNIHTFDSTREAYDAAQICDDIHDGDVLAVPSEGVVGILRIAWPVAVTAILGEFHGYDGDLANEDDGRYAASVARARDVATAIGAGLPAAHDVAPTPRGGA